MLTYPHINPIAISIGPILGVGPLRVHWYGIMYLIGFAAAWWLAKYRARRPGSTWVALDIDDLIFYCAIGVIVGGRTGWCIFYGHEVIAENWLNAFHIWDGGMCAGQGQANCRCARFPGALAGHRTPRRPTREFHQWRTVGQAHGSAVGIRRAELGGRADRAPSIAA